MDNNFKNALANVQLEGYEFTTEQIEFISDLVERINNGELTWDEAIVIIKSRHSRGETKNETILR